MKSESLLNIECEEVRAMIKVYCVNSEFDVKVFRYSFSEAIPIFFNRLKSVFLLGRSLQNFPQ